MANGAAERDAEQAMWAYVVDNSARACWFGERAGGERLLPEGARHHFGVTVTEPSAVRLPPDAPFAVERGDLLCFDEEKGDGFSVRRIPRVEAERGLVRIVADDMPIAICGLDIPLKDQILKMNATAAAVLLDHDAIILTPPGHYRDVEARAAMEYGLAGRLGVLAAKATEVPPGTFPPKLTGVLDALVKPLALAAEFPGLLSRSLAVAADIRTGGKARRIDGPFSHTVHKGGFAIHYEDGNGGSRVYRDPEEGPAIECAFDEARNVYTVRGADGGVERLTAAEWAARAAPVPGPAPGR